MRLKKKRAFSLVEILISLGLVALLLSSLAFWYRSITTQKAIFNHLKGPLMEERYAHQRLQRVLPSAQSPFFTSASEGSLVFIFDRGTCVEPKLSGKVLGKLYFDQASQSLCLGIWPFPEAERQERSPSQHFVLLDGVQACHFKFYSPPDLFQKPVDPETVGLPRPQEGWQDTWLSDYATIPALINVVITRCENRGIDDHIIEYLFDLPIGILYPKDTA